MDELYTEILISRKPGFANSLIRVFLITFTVAFFLAGIMIHPLILIAGLAMAAADMILLPRQNVEFEYLYVAGELDVDKIFSKSRRKKAGTYSLSQMEIMAPQDSHHLDEYRKGNNIKVIDYTSGDPEDRNPRYAFVISQNGTRQMVLFEPNDKVLKDIRMRMPSKTFLD